MKITDVKVLRANRAVYCKIYTDEGIVGLGESGAWGFLEASAQAILTMGEYLIGQDPLDIEHHWQYLYRFSHFRGAAVMGAISAIDIALYDIAGKYFHVPVYRLLGGKCRDKVRVYNHTAGRTEEELAANAIKGVSEGYTALGHLNPYLDEPRTQPYADGNAAMLYKAERRIAKIREAVGQEIDLCLELHRRLEPGLAVQLSARLEPYNIMFLEDPIRPDNFEEMGHVARQCRIPIATGERIHTVHEFEQLLNQNACSYHDKPRERKKLSQEKEFRQIKNAVIQEAERIRLGEISFEDDGISQTDEPEHVRDESQACRELWRIIRNEDISLDYRDRAAEKLEQVAECGDARAQYRIGQLYRDGPLLIPDNHKAKYWLSQAAIQGLPEAQYALGKLLLSDDWEVRDPDEGIRWLKQAAENGSHFAAYRLGKEYLEGNTVNKDTTKAVDWFAKSAEAGNQYAQYMLGKLYLMGQGLPRDQAQAMVWFSHSAAQGNQYAQFFLEQRNDLRSPSVMLAVTQLLYHMSRIFQDNSVPPAVPMGQQVDRKLRRKIQEKKIAMGHKPDDHEEQWPEMTM